MNLTERQQVFFALLKAGLWEKGTRLSQFSPIDFGALYKLAEEQSVVGLIAAGLEHIEDMTLTKPQVMPFMKNVIALESKNLSMDAFVSKLWAKMAETGIRSLLVKGQGIAQCYEKPLWRSCGDVDLFLDEENYAKGKVYFASVADHVHEENLFDKHFSVDLDGFLVELHGSMRSMLTKRADDYVDALQLDLFNKERHRIWDNNGTLISLPSPDEDIIYVFTHILKHFFNYGIGLRQFCDLYRLLYTYHDEIDLSLLESRLQGMGMMTEWKVFAALAVHRLGMPPEYMPFYSPATTWKRKADRVLSLVLETGNFGHNRDNDYYQNSNSFVRGLKSFWRHTWDSIRQSFIFPLDSLRIWVRVLVLGFSDAMKGKN